MKHTHQQNAIMTETGTALMQLLAKEPQGSTITTRMSKRQESKGRHQSLRGSMAWLTSWFRSTLWNCERIHFCCFKNQFVILTYGSPRKFMNLITQNSRLAHYCPVQYWLHLHFPFPGKSNAEMSHVRQTKDNVRFSSQSRGRKREREREREAVISEVNISRSITSKIRL